MANDKGGTDQQCCRNCLAYMPAHAGARNGSCRRRSPAAVMIGVQQQQPLASLPGLKGPRVVQQVPIVQGFFPPVDESVWCMDWLPRPALPQIARDEVTVQAEQTAEKVAS